ncbi:MAG: hypothetical protein H0Z33_13660 [Bacillaceae bacterium]|nr:hypothetical protein [Bacillaceae bacterium]
MSLMEIVLQIKNIQNIDWGKLTKKERDDLDQTFVQLLESLKDKIAKEKKVQY